MWRAALDRPIVAQALSGRTDLRQQTLRLWGTPESELAATLRASSWPGLEITTCLRDGELEIVTRYEPNAEQTYQRLAGTLRAEYADTIFSADGRTIDEIVADGLCSRGLTIATGESCTGGLLAARLIDRAGSSDYVLGGVVSYSNEAKQTMLDVPAELIETVGAVSAEVANALAEGARRRLGADVGVGITGIAGPGGGSTDKPVGLVYLAAVRDGARVARRVVLPGSRTDIRTRSVVLAMHMLRELLQT
jgi:nicotinamide-nucleotide amidase